MMMMSIVMMTMIYDDHHEKKVGNTSLTYMWIPAVMMDQNMLLTAKLPAVSTWRTAHDVGCCCIINMCGERERERADNEINTSAFKHGLIVEVRMAGWNE